MLIVAIQTLTLLYLLPFLAKLRALLKRIFISSSCELQLEKVVQASFEVYPFPQQQQNQTLHFIRVHNSDFRLYSPFQYFWAQRNNRKVKKTTTTTEKIVYKKIQQPH